MSDLISRKALIEDIHALRQQVFISDEVGHNRPFSDKANIIECINNQPTAYDVDKVVERLKAEKEESYQEEYFAYGNGVSFAVDVVKGAVKDE